MDRAAAERSSVRHQREPVRQLLGAEHGAHESGVHQLAVGPQHLHLQPQDLQGDQRPFQAGRALDRREEESFVQARVSHQITSFFYNCITATNPPILHCLNTLKEDSLGWC